MLNNFTKPITLLLFLNVFFYFLFPLQDNDISWHIKTGEFILNHFEIPQNDPFSYVNFPITDLGEFILKQYWLCQVFFWLLYSKFGVGSLVILNATLLLATCFTCFQTIKHQRYLAYFIIAFYLCFFIQGFDGLRTQTFTFLFSAILLYYLTSPQKILSKAFNFTPLLFLLWCNLHGGYIFGILILLICTFSGIVSLYLPSFFTKTLSKKEVSKVFIITICSTLISFFNPNGFEAFLYAINTHATTIFSQIAEYKSPLNLYEFSLVQLVKFWFPFIFSVVVVLCAAIQRKLFPFLLVTAVSIMALTAIRYYPLLLIVTTVSFGQIAIPFRESSNNLLSKLFGVSIVGLLGIYLFYNISHTESDTFTIKHSLFNPSRAVSFMSSNGIQGNIFGSYNKSGHIILGTFPASRVFWSSNFISGERFEKGLLLQGKYLEREFDRALYSLFNEKIGLKFDNTRSAQDKKNYEEWLSYLEQTNTEVVIHELANMFSGQPARLVFLLEQHPDWEPVYSDGEVIIFLKNINKFKDTISRNRLQEGYIADQMIAEGSRGLLLEGGDFPAFVALGLLLKENYTTEVEHYIKLAITKEPSNKLANLANLIYQKWHPKTDKL